MSNLTSSQELFLMLKDTSKLYDQAPCGYHSVDNHGVVTNINQTLLKWLGYEKDEVVGKLKFIDLFSGELEEFEQKMALLGKGKIAKTDVNLVRKSGEHFPVILGMMPGDDDPSQKSFSTLDNSRCHEALERIKTLDQELEGFSYSISHDLRAPLRSIDGYSRILQEDYATNLDEEGRRVLNVVTSNAKRMGKLIDDLLEFGRLGRKSLQRTHVNMAGIVKSVMHELTMHEPDRRIEFHAQDVLPASADSDMMRQVWFNLLENAVKYSGKREYSLIHVRSYKLGDHEVCYEVQDNGVGFDMQYAEKLFGMFQRLHKMQDFSGTGVGLAIVKRIISRHGGRVWAKALLDQGATFYFTLPIDHEI